MNIKTSNYKGLENFNEVILFSSHDHQFIQTIANRVIEITPKGLMDRKMEFDEYLEDTEVQKQLQEMYK